MTEETTANVKFVRLSNGDDIITEIHGETKTNFLLKNSMRVLVETNLELAKQTIYMHPWMPQGITKEDSCTLYKKDVIFVAELEKDIEEYYKAMVFDMLEDLPVEIAAKPQYLDDAKKVISFNKNTRDIPKSPKE